MLGKQPNTIDGYRSLILDKLEINISKDENLARLLDSFLRDRPRGRSGIPSWNFSLTVHQLRLLLIQSRRPPWSIWPSRRYSSWPLGRASAKWDSCLAKLIYWTPIRLVKGVPVSITQLSILESAGHRVSSVAPGVITALASTLDRSLKSDRSLCPVRALCYYLDRTSDIGQNKEVAFVSFKKGFNKDISPATISSWIKQTVILCYELSDQEAHI